MSEPPLKRRATRPVGQRGEAFASAYLEASGYRILARNWRHGRLGEIDLIVQPLNQPDLHVFVEVKTRSPQQFQTAIDSITPAKQRRMGRLALAYLSGSGQADLTIRFDVLLVGLPPAGSLEPPQIQHFINAFQPG
jgi:putative endonuclease